MKSFVMKFLTTGMFAFALSLFAFAVPEFSVELENGGFEFPANTNYYQSHIGCLPGGIDPEGVKWVSIRPNMPIEFGSVAPGEFCASSRSAYHTVATKGGYQFCELCSEQVNGIFQIVKTVPGETRHWGFSYKGRESDELTDLWIMRTNDFVWVRDNVYLPYTRGMISFDEATNTVVRSATNYNWFLKRVTATPTDYVNWEKAFGDYTVPDDQEQMVVALVAWNPNPGHSRGSLVDRVYFTTNTPVERAHVKLAVTSGGLTTAKIGDVSTLVVNYGSLKKSVDSWVKVGEPINLKVVAQKGYTFAGAFTNANVIGAAAAFTADFDAITNQTVVASGNISTLVFTKPRTITFVLGYDCDVPNEVELDVVNSGYVLPKPSVTGLVFAGWRTPAGDVIPSGAGVFYNGSQLVTKRIDDSTLAIDADLGMILRAEWHLDTAYLPDGAIRFVDTMAFGPDREVAVALPVNESIGVTDNPRLAYRNGFYAFKHIGWFNRSEAFVFSTNICATSVAVDDMMMKNRLTTVSDADGRLLFTTNCPEITLESIWKLDRTNDWSVVHNYYQSFATTNFYSNLSSALAVLRDGDELNARPANRFRGYGIGDGLIPDTNDTLAVDCPFIITNNGVTVNFNGRVLNRSEEMYDYLFVAHSARNVTLKNGYFFGVENSLQGDPIGPQNCRAFAAVAGSELKVENCVVRCTPTNDMIMVVERSSLKIADSYVDGDGDGASNVVCARNNSKLELVNVKGLWNEGSFWNPGENLDSFNYITGEQFVLEDSELVLDHTVVSGGVLPTASKYPYVVITRGDSKIMLLNDGGIMEDTDLCAGAINVDSGSCFVISGEETDSLHLPEGFVIGPISKSVGATVKLGPGCYSQDPSESMISSGTLVHVNDGEHEYYEIYRSSGNGTKDKLQYLLHESGVTNIHVCAFTPFPASSKLSVIDSGNASIWMSMNERGLVKKAYLDFHNCGPEELETHIPDGFFPTNTVRASVWRGRGSVLTNVYQSLSCEVADTIFDPEVVNLLTNFGPAVMSITHGVGSADFPYVDENGTKRLGKVLSFGCEPGDTTLYDIIVNEFKKSCTGYEKAVTSDARAYYVTNNTSVVFGMLKPVVLIGSLGYIQVYSSEDAFAASIANREIGNYTGPGSWYYRLRADIAEGAAAAIAGGDKSLLTRNYKVEGFERFAYKFRGVEYQKAVAEAVSDFTIGVVDPLIGNLTDGITNNVFNFVSTLCSEECTDTNSRMRIDIQGSKATHRFFFGLLNLSDRFLVNLGLIDDDYVTFDEEWVVNKAIASAVSAYASIGREILGLDGVTYRVMRGPERVSTHADIGYKPQRLFSRLFASGQTGCEEANPCEALIPTSAVLAISYQPDARAWAQFNSALFSLMGYSDERINYILNLIANRADDFGGSAAIAVLNGASVDQYGRLESGLDFLSFFSFKNDALWSIIQTLLQANGAEVVHLEGAPDYIVCCVLPNGKTRIVYDRSTKIAFVATSAAACREVCAIYRGSVPNLFKSGMMNDHFGVAEDERIPAHNMLYHFAPTGNMPLLNSLDAFFQEVGLGAFNILSRYTNISGFWSCGYAVADRNTEILHHYGFISTNVANVASECIEAMNATFGQVMAKCYPYDCSRSQVFANGTVELHVSRAENCGMIDGVPGLISDELKEDRLWGEMPAAGNLAMVAPNVRVRVILKDDDGVVFHDDVHGATLNDEGYLSVRNEGVEICGVYLTSEGAFGHMNCGPHGHFIARPAPEITPELSMLPSAEEIAAQLHAALANFGITNINIGAISDAGCGPEGESNAAVRVSTVRYSEGSGLDLLHSSSDHTNCFDVSCYMPADTLFGVSLKCGGGVITNIMNAIGYVQPALADFITEIFRNALSPENIGALRGGFAAGLLPGDADYGSIPLLNRLGYLVVGVDDEDLSCWNSFTNTLATSPRVEEFKSIPSPYGARVTVKFRDLKRTFVITRPFSNGGQYMPVIIFTTNIEAARHITLAGMFGEDRLIDDETFNACRGDLDLTDGIGFQYYAPGLAGVWFVQKFDHGVEPCTSLLTTRTTDEFAVAFSTVLHFADNFVSTVSGKDTVLTFDYDQAVSDHVTQVRLKSFTAIRDVCAKLGIQGVNYYDLGFDADGKWGNAEIAFATTGADSKAMRAVAWKEPSEDIVIERFIADNVAGVATFDRDPVVATNIIDSAFDSFASLLDEQFPSIASAIRRFADSDTCHMIMLGSLMTGNYRGVAITQDKDNPFFTETEGISRAVSDGYALTIVLGQAESDLVFMALRNGILESDNGLEWTAFAEGGAQYIACTNVPLVGKFVIPTIAYDPQSRVLVFSTALSAARSAMKAGIDGEGRLVDSVRFHTVMGLGSDETLPAHNNFTYVAPDNDERLGVTLRNAFKTSMPESYGILFDAPNLDRYWGGFYGVRDGSVYRMHVRSASYAHTAFTAAAQAALKTIAEEAQALLPYTGTNVTEFVSADVRWVVKGRGDGTAYLSGEYNGDCRAQSVSTSSPTVCSDVNRTWAFILAQHCLFTTVTFNDPDLVGGCVNGFTIAFANSDYVHQTADCAVAVEMGGEYIKNLPAGEEVDIAVTVSPRASEITSVSKLPKGLKFNKKHDKDTGLWTYSITGTPKNVGETVEVVVHAECDGFVGSDTKFTFNTLNYRSAAMSPELEQVYDCFLSGVSNSLCLAQTVGWTAKGIPSGLTFDDVTGVISGVAKKPGEYVVTFTKKVDGTKETASTILAVGQNGIKIAAIPAKFVESMSQRAPEPPPIDAQAKPEFDRPSIDVYIGVKFNWVVFVDGLDGVENKVKAKGLPAGLKLVSYDDGSYAIEGRPTRASKTDKATGELVPFKFTISASNCWGWTGEAEYELTVKPLPDWVPGEYNGFCFLTADGSVVASYTAKIANNGKISCKLYGVRKHEEVVTDTFSLPGFDEYNTQEMAFVFDTRVKLGSGDVDFVGAVGVDDPSADIVMDENTPHRMGVFMGFGEDLHLIQSIPNYWENFFFPKGVDKIELEFKGVNQPELAGAKFAFKQSTYLSGKVSISGHVPGENGAQVKISGTSTAVVDVDAIEIVGQSMVLPIGVGFPVKKQSGNSAPYYAVARMYVLATMDGRVLSVSETNPLED